jgi:hypothetical protein
MDDTDYRMPTGANVGGPGCTIARSAHVLLRQYYLTKCSGMAPVAPTRREGAASIIGGSLGISGPAERRPSSSGTASLPGDYHPRLRGTPNRPPAPGGL